MKRVEQSRRQKIGTVLDEKLLTAAKILAAKEHKRLAQFLEEALREHLRRKQAQSVVARTRGAIKASPEVVTVALALSHGITALASADRDFERVSELIIYKPTDVTA